MQIQQNWLYLFYLPPVNKKDVYITVQVISNASGYLVRI